MADPLDIPDFLLIKNRKPLTPEREKAVAEALTKHASTRTEFFNRFKSEDARRASELLAEEKRQASITAMKARLTKSKSKASAPPAGATWDTRTSRWVMPGGPSISVAQTIADSRTTRQIMEELREEAKMTTAANKPDFSTMSGKQLLEAYNALVASPRKAKFSDRAQGVASCETAWKTKHPDPLPAAKPSPAKNATGPKPPAKEKTILTDPAAASAGARSKKLGMKITIVTEKNPRREGTDAHRHYEAMRGSPTVLQYLEKFAPEARRTASQWLSNTVRDGHVKVG